MPDPTLLEALRACAVVFPNGVLTVVGKAGCGSPVSVPLGDGATQEAIAALAEAEARPLLEPHALDVAIRERDDARAHVDRLARARDAAEESEAATAKAHDEAMKALEVAIRERDDARATVDRLAYEVAANRATIAELTAKCRDEKRAHGDAQAAAEKRAAESMDKLARQWAEAWTRAEAAEARIKALETSAEPFEWGIFSPAPDDRMQESFATEAEAEADLEYYPRGFLVSPLYRHPPRPAGKPVVWAVVFPDGFANTYQTEADARRSYSCGKGRLVPLYEATPQPATEATPSGCVDHGPDGDGC